MTFTYEQKNIDSAELTLSFKILIGTLVMSLIIIKINFYEHGFKQRLLNERYSIRKIIEYAQMETIKSSQKRHKPPLT